MKAYRKEINGIELYYEYYHRSPTSKTIVLIHGFLSSSFSFRRLHPFLKQDFNIISLDVPPFGKSGKSTRFNYSYENVAKTVIDFIESLQFNEIILIGHSLGGQLCLHISRLRPDFINSSVLLCSSAYLKRPKTYLALLSYLPFFHLAVKRQLAKSGLRENLQKVVHDQSLIDDEMMSGYLEPFLEEDIFRALTRMIRDRENDLSDQQLKEIHTPCLLIWGEHDRVVPVSVGNRLHRDLRNSEFVVLKETGHLVPEERPEDVYSYIKDFVFKNHVS